MTAGSLKRLRAQVFGLDTLKVVVVLVQKLDFNLSMVMLAELERHRNIVRIMPQGHAVAMQRANSIRITAGEESSSYSTVLNNGLPNSALSQSLSTYTALTAIQTMTVITKRQLKMGDQSTAGTEQAYVYKHRV